MHTAVGVGVTPKVLRLLLLELGGNGFAASLSEVLSWGRASSSDTSSYGEIGPRPICSLDVKTARWLLGSVSIEETDASPDLLDGFRVPEQQFMQKRVVFF